MGQIVYRYCVHMNEWVSEATYLTSISDCLTVVKAVELMRSTGPAAAAAAAVDVASLTDVTRPASDANTHHHCSGAGNLSRNPDDSRETTRKAMYRRQRNSAPNVSVISRKRRRKMRSGINRKWSQIIMFSWLSQTAASTLLWLVSRSGTRCLTFCVLSTLTDVVSASNVCLRRTCFQRTEASSTLEVLP